MANFIYKHCDIPSTFFKTLCNARCPEYTKSNTIVLGIDPGYTTGIAAIKNGRLILWGQLNTKELTLETYNTIYKMISEIKEQALANTNTSENGKFTLVIEDYRIYSWKSEAHEWSEVYVARLIGFILSVCVQLEVVPVFRLAVDAKKFMSDDKLKACDWYLPGYQHSRDAIRHCCYQILFGK